MSYTQVCPECGLRSGSDEGNCPGCGAEKGINIEGSEPSEVLYNEIDSGVHFFEKPSLYIKILISLIVFVGVIFFLPEFLRKSEMFWMLYAASNVFTVIKEADAYFLNLHGIYFCSRVLFFMYLGAGAGNLLSHAGKYTRSILQINDYFNPAFLYSELIHGNFLMILGAAAGAIFIFHVRSLSKSLSAD